MVQRAAATGIHKLVGFCFGRTTRLATFPDYLMVQLKKFTIGDDWVPKKLDVSVDIPDILDLSHLRGSGKQDGEEELPEGGPPAEEPGEWDRQGGEVLFGLCHRDGHSITFLVSVVCRSPTNNRMELFTCVNSCFSSFEYISAFFNVILSLQHNGAWQFHFFTCCQVHHCNGYVIDLQYKLRLGYPWVASTCVLP